MKLRQITKQLRQQTAYFMLLQLGAVFAFSALFALLWGTSTGASAFVGGLTYAIPNLYFAWRFFGATGALASKEIVRGMYRAEMIKLLLTGLLFLVVFLYLPIDVLPFFMGFVFAQITGWVSSYYLGFKGNR